MKHEAPWISEWIYRKATDNELKDNCIPNIERVDERKIEVLENMISSHFVYKAKVNKIVRREKIFTLKARFCAHGNKDSECEYLRTDAAVSSHTSFRLIYSTSVMLEMKLAKADVQRPCAQSGKAQRKF